MAIENTQMIGYNSRHTASGAEPMPPGNKHDEIFHNRLDKHHENPSVRSAFQKHGFEIRAIDARLQAVPQVPTDFTTGSLLVLQAHIVHVSESPNGTQPGSEMKWAQGSTVGLEREETKKTL